MKATAPILAAAGLVALSGAFVAGRLAAPPAIPTDPVAAFAAGGTPSPSGPATVTVVGTGQAIGTPNQASMTFGVDFTAGSASAALNGEEAAANKLLKALEVAGIAEPDIQTQWVSLYFDSQRSTFDASSSVTATLRSLSRAGSAIDAAVAAAGDSIRLSGISLSIADTGSLMGQARKAAVTDAAVRAQQYAQGAGLKLGRVISITESDNTPSPIRYQGAAPAAPAQPIEAGQQTLSVSVMVVYALGQ